MKLTLWTQFSSNHSAGFLLVGQFASPPLAEEAAQRLREILVRIQAQWQQEQKLAERDLSYEPYVLTPVEKQIRDEYQLNSFDMSLDWWLEGDDLYYISVQRDIVILRPPSTHNGPFPFPELVEKIGGKASFWSVMHENDLFFTLICTLPTLQDVEAMWSHIKHSTDRVNRPVIRVPKVQFIQGKVERNDFTIRFLDVDLHTDTLAMPTVNGLINQNEIASFEEQFLNFLNFIESYPCTSIEYTFYHTEPEWDIPE